MQRPQLDRIDLKILSRLEEHGRMTNRDLSEDVGLSQSACLDRVRRLERAGVIAGYKALLDGRKLGDWITVVAQITLASHSQAQQRTFEDRVRTCDNIVDCVEVGGACDYIARFACPSLTAYQDLTASLLGDPALGLKEIKSHIAMRRVKGDAHVPAGALQDTGKSP